MRGSWQQTPSPLTVSRSMPMGWALLGSVIRSGGIQGICKVIELAELWSEGHQDQTSLRPHIISQSCPHSLAVGGLCPYSLATPKLSRVTTMYSSLQPENIWLWSWQNRKSPWIPDDLFFSLSFFFVSHLKVHCWGTSSPFPPNPERWWFGTGIIRCCQWFPHWIHLNFQFPF